MNSHLATLILRKLLKCIGIVVHTADACNVIATTLKMPNIWKFKKPLPKIIHQTVTTTTDASQYIKISYAFQIKIFAYKQQTFFRIIFFLFLSLVNGDWKI